MYEKLSKIETLCMESNQPLLDLIAIVINEFIRDTEWAGGFHIFDEVIECFETYGYFLNDIQEGENKLSAFENIMSWINGYYVTNVFASDGYGTYYPKVDAGKKIKKMTRIIDNFENIIVEQFGEYLEEIEEYGSDYHIRGEFRNELDQISNTLDCVRRLKKDLQEKNFHIFQRNRFYKKDRVSKQDFKWILKDIKIANNLTVSDSDINDLINNLPNSPTLIKDL